MWRATVIKVHSPGWVTVTIPSLFRYSPVGPIQSAVDAQVDERVIVADLNPDNRSRDWWVVGFENSMGKWGAAYPHTHPLGQVEGLNDALATKAPTTALAAKADAPPAWTPVSSSYWVTDGTAARGLSLRPTAFGMQLSGRVRITVAAAMDTVVATVPAGFTPPFPMMFDASTTGPGPGYEALSYQFELHADGQLTAREAFAVGARLTVNTTLIY